MYFYTSWYYYTHGTSPSIKLAVYILMGSAPVCEGERNTRQNYVQQLEMFCAKRGMRLTRRTEIMVTFQVEDSTGEMHYYSSSARSEMAAVQESARQALLFYEMQDRNKATAQCSKQSDLPTVPPDLSHYSWQDAHRVEQISLLDLFRSGDYFLGPCYMDCDPDDIKGIFTMFQDHISLEESTKAFSKVVKEGNFNLDKLHRLIFWFTKYAPRDTKLKDHLLNFLDTAKWLGLLSPEGRRQIIVNAAQQTHGKAPFLDIVEWSILNCQLGSEFWDSVSMGLEPEDASNLRATLRLHRLHIL